MTKRDDKETDQDDEDTTSPNDDARDSDAPASDGPASDSASAKKASKPSDESDDDEDEDDEEDAEERSEKTDTSEKSGEAGDESDDDVAARQAEDEEDSEEDSLEEHAATQLGHRRYVMTTFMFLGAVGAYVVGRTIFGVWTHYANRDFFALNLPSLAAIPDDRKEAIAMIIAGIVAIFVVVRLYRKPDIQQWSDEVASEMSKVKWPTRKEVTGSTIVVIAASAAATLYLFMLDRFWGFVTNLVYGTAS